MLQAENAHDQMDWIEKITGVISSLLSFQAPERVIVHNVHILKHMKPLISIVFVMVIINYLAASVN